MEIFLVQNRRIRTRPLQIARTIGTGPHFRIIRNDPLIRSIIEIQIAIFHYAAIIFSSIIRTVTVIGDQSSIIGLSTIGPGSNLNIQSHYGMTPAIPSILFITAEGKKERSLFTINGFQSFFCRKILKFLNLIFRSFCKLVQIVPAYHRFRIVIFTRIIQRRQVLSYLVQF